MRHGARHRVAAFPLAALTGLVLLAALVLLGLNANRMTGKIVVYVAGALAGVIYAGTGQLVTRRVRGNAIGWLLGLIGLALAADMLAEQYALYGLATDPGSLPGARAAGWLAGVMYLSTFAPMPFLVLLFPDGRLPSPRWRPVLWALLAVMAGWAAQQFQAGLTITGGFTNALDIPGVRYPNPVGILPRHGWFSDLLALLVPVGLAAVALVVASVFARRRGASAERRKQLAWLGYVGLLVVIPVAGLGLYALSVHGQVSNALGEVFWGFLLVAPTIGIPVACAVAVLKYRLYEIDKIISRTLAYAIVTGLLAGVYSGLVLLATQLLKLHGPATVAVATLAAAALFTPLRSRVQRRVDHRFNRVRYDADQALAAFATRLKDAVDLDSVRDDLTVVVHQALEPAHISVWVSQHG